VRAGPPYEFDSAGQDGVTEGDVPQAGDHETSFGTMATGYDKINWPFVLTVLRAPGRSGCASRSELKSVLREGMLASLDALPAKMNADRLIDTFTARVRRAHPNRPAPFRADVTVIDPTSAFQAPTQDRYALMVGGLFRGGR
jgi:hypothetical protein